MNLNKIYNMDCRIGMAQMSPNSVDEIITDPPFAIKFGAKKSNYNRKAGKVLQGYVEIPEEKYGDFTLDWMSFAKDMLKETGSMFIFSGYNNVDHIIHAAKKLFGFSNFQQLIWKYNFGLYTQRRFVTAHYNVIFVWKSGKHHKFFPSCRFKSTDRTKSGRSEQYADMESVWTIKKEYWSGKQKTPTKLPAEVIKKCLEYTTRPGDIICDPFLGSGQVAVVSKAMSRKYIGFEIVKNYYNFATKRLK